MPEREPAEASLQLQCHYERSCIQAVPRSIATFNMLCCFWRKILVTFELHSKQQKVTWSQQKKWRVDQVRNKEKPFQLVLSCTQITSGDKTPLLLMTSPLEMSEWPSCWLMLSRNGILMNSAVAEWFKALHWWEKINENQKITSSF